MKEKAKIIGELGMKELLLPSLISDALQANDKVKYFFSLLQAAKHHAENPQIELSNLRNEREEYGISDSSFDTAVDCSTMKLNVNSYYIPNVNRIVTNIFENINQMIMPLQTFSDIAYQNDKHESTVLTDSKPIQLAEYDKLRDRFKELLARVPRIDEDVISDMIIDTFISAETKKGDSFHLIVMGIHKGLTSCSL